MTATKPVRVRFAPSPTGHLHIGGARTALYNYLLARQTGGQFLLRIEDTDRKRFVEGAEEELKNSLRWLGIQWDEGIDVGGEHGPYRQSERKAIYQEYARELVAGGHAYPCFCSAERLDRVRTEQQKNKEIPHYDGTCRALSPEEAAARVAAGESHVIRFKTPREGATTVRDLVRGEITVQNSTLDDYILVKSDGLALYHLAAMVDDHLMQITHVIRGAEWLATLPLHCLIIRAMGWQEPVWTHLSVFLKPSGKGKMSKRESADLIKDGHSIFVKDLADLGYLPEAVVNWVALMGWSYDDHTEIFSMADLIDKFNLERLNPSPAAINFTKFDHFNGVYIRSLAVEDLARRIQPFFAHAGLKADMPTLMKITPIIQERLNGLDEAPEIAGFFFRETVTPEAADLVAKNMTAAQAARVARDAHAILAALPEITPALAELPMRGYVEQSGFSAGQVFGILRIAVTGQKVSPPLFESMEIIGRERVLSRILLAAETLEGMV